LREKERQRQIDLDEQRKR
jgi:hypothetical protein